MTVNALAASPTLRSTRPTAAADWPEIGDGKDNEDKIDLRAEGEKPGSNKLAFGLGGAVLGGLAGAIAMKFVSPLLAPLIGLGVGAAIYQGGLRINGTPLREWLSPFKVKDGDSEEVQKTKARNNKLVRIGAAVVGGLVATSFAAPALVLTSAAAGLVAGWKLARES